MRADGVDPACHAGGDHLPQEDAVVDGVHAVVDAGDTRRAAHDDGLWIALANACRAQPDQLDESFGAQWMAAPLARQVRLVPQLVRGNAPAIAGCQGEREPLEDGEIERRTIFFDRFRSTEPRRFRDAEQDFEPVRLGLVDELIEIVPAVFTRRRFDQVPVNLLLDPADAQIGSPGDVRRAIRIDELALHPVLGLGTGVGVGVGDGEGVAVGRSAGRSVGGEVGETAGDGTGAVHAVIAAATGGEV
jgi:hypothetical protein